MENTGEVADDQGSGWLEVKKKHRSSAKFSVQSWSRGFSGENGTSCHQNSEKNGNGNGKYRSQYTKKGINVSFQGNGDVIDSASLGDEGGNDVPCSSKSVSKDDKSLNSSESVVANSRPRAEDAKKVIHTHKTDAIPKIKWGDLDDAVLVKPLNNNLQWDAKFDGAGCNKLVAGKLENNFHLVSDASPYTDIQDNKLMTSPVAVSISCDETVSPSNKEDIIEANCKEVSESSLSDTSVLIMNRKMTAPNDILNCTQVHSESFQSTENKLSSTSQSSEAGIMLKLQVPVLLPEVNDSDIANISGTEKSSTVVPHESESVVTENGETEISGEADIVVKLQLPVVSAVNESKCSDFSVTNRNTGTVGIPLDDESLLPKNSDPGIPEDVGEVVKLPLPVISEVNESQLSNLYPVNGISSPEVVSHDNKLLASEKLACESLGEPVAIASVEDCRSPPDETRNDALLNAQTVSSFEEEDTSESKERFRERLWCFLFENLNRSVDELYLLCELECDIEQMKEAILVLEEAASDFKELTTRVKEFENVKRSSSQAIDRVPTKSDHRRPHALSWEVRRMTSSPHRAEILSSSLEAFKKIQQERANMLAANTGKTVLIECSTAQPLPVDNVKTVQNDARDSIPKSRKQAGCSDLTQIRSSGEKQNVELGRSSRVNFVQNSHGHPLTSSSFNPNLSRFSSRDSSAVSAAGKIKKELEVDKSKKEKTFIETVDRNVKSIDLPRKQIPYSEKDKEKRKSASWKSMDAWKEKRNWEDILSSRVSHSPGLSRKSAERARVLHDKLMSPDKKKKNALDLKREAEEKHARAMRIRNELENERVQKLQRTSEKLNRVNEWQAVRTMKLREGMYARHQRGESRHEAFLAQVARRAGDESSKVNEVRFITSLNEENKKLILRQKLQDSELRRAEKLLVIKTKQKEDMAREEAVLERRKLIEAEKLQRLAETQRKKEEAQVRREEERKASSAAREARAIEQLRRREERAKAQQEEAELLAQKLAERLSESEQRRKFYLEQIRERASMDFRDQSSPLMRRSTTKDGQGRSTPTNSGDAYPESAGAGSSTLATGNATLQQPMKRRIKKIRQRLMALKFEFPEPSVSSENAGIGYRTSVATARGKLGRWLQELQRLRQARKEGATNIGLITADMIKFLEGKDAELQASRQAGLLDFIASALPASHTSKPEACQVTIHLLKLLKVVLSVPANRSYFLAQNLSPPIIPMLSASLETYIKIAASLNAPGTSNLPSSKTSVENFESISQVLDNFLWVVGTIIRHPNSDEREIHMRDGLLELLTAYQVIHRLRDLFALYDRPQVEGSPFPSSILLSIHLLVVSTYRPETVSSIDWETSIMETTQSEIQQFKLAEIVDLDDDCRPPLSVLNGSGLVSSADKLADRQSHESFNRIDESLSACKDGENKPTYGAEGLNGACVDLQDVPDESQKIPVEKDDKRLIDVVTEPKNDTVLNSKHPIDFVLSAISETGLVSLPSLLTSVLLQANNRLSSEQGSYVLPSNFEEVATGVLKVLNNLAFLDMTFVQRMLARPDLKMEFFHLMSFLLSHCTSKWKVATDQVGLLLLESLLLLGYFALFHHKNQAVLRWGKSPTILHKVCDLPFVFFSDPELMPVLGGTLVAACYGCQQNKSVVLQELSMDMLLSLLISCKNVRTNLISENSPIEDSGENNQQISELKKTNGDMPVRSNRNNPKSTRVSLGKGSSLGNGTRGGRTRSQRDSKMTKSSEDSIKHNPRAPEASVMLHCRFPCSFIDRAEQFFSAEDARRSEI